MLVPERKGSVACNFSYQRRGADSIIGGDLKLHEELKMGSPFLGAQIGV